MYFHCFYKTCDYLLRIFTHFIRWVMFASSLPQEFWFSYKDFHQQLKRRPRWIMLASKRPPWSKVEWTAKMNHVSIKVAVSPLFFFFISLSLSPERFKGSPRSCRLSVVPYKQASRQSTGKKNKQTDTTTSRRKTANRGQRQQASIRRCPLCSVVKT